MCGLYPPFKNSLKIILLKCKISLLKIVIYYFVSDYNDLVYYFKSGMQFFIITMATNLAIENIAATSTLESYN